MSDQPAILTERHGNVLVIRLNRPDARNAVNGAVATGLEAAIDDLEGDDTLLCGVLAANGPIFCAGADLKLVATGRGAEMATVRGGFAGLVRRPRTKPMVAAIHSDALAGGFEIALACDLLVAAAGAELGLPEVKRSLVALGGGLVERPPGRREAGARVRVHRRCDPGRAPRARRPGEPRRPGRRRGSRGARPGPAHRRQRPARRPRLVSHHPRSPRGPTPRPPGTSRCRSASRYSEAPTLSRAPPRSCRSDRRCGRGVRQRSLSTS